jgi:tetratricopeptide (TPR) repeat protein
MDDEWGQANALAHLGNVSWNVGDYVKANDYFEVSLAFRRRIGDNHSIAASLDRLGLLLMHQGQLELSSQYLEQAIELYSRLGDHSGLANTLENMGSNRLEMGLLTEAHDHYAEAATLYEELGIRHTGFTVLKALLTYASVHLGAYERANQEGQTAVALSRDFGHRRSEGLALLALGMSAVALGDDAAAAAYLADGTEHLLAINQREELALGIGVQALVAFRQGELDEARLLVLSALRIVTEIRGLTASPGFALAVWALLLADQGEYEQAASVYQLVLAEPFAAASRWFADMFAGLIPHSPPAGLMPPEERWAAIGQLYDSLQ